MHILNDIEGFISFYVTENLQNELLEIGFELNKSKHEEFQICYVKIWFKEKVEKENKS